MDAFVQHHLDILPENDQLGRLAEKGFSSTMITYARTPKKDMVDGEQVWTYPASETHFSPDGNHEANGMPRISLYQGFKKSQGGPPDPSTLPDGKTLEVLLDEALLEQAGGDKDEALRAAGTWNSKERRYEVHLIWDFEGWTSWQTSLRERKLKRTQQWQQRQAAVQQPLPENAITLDEYTERQKHRRAARRG